MNFMYFENNEHEKAVRIVLLLLGSFYIAKYSLQQLEKILHVEHNNSNGTNIVQSELLLMCVRNRF